MPNVFRSMISDGGLPVVGTDRNMLGARVPIDIEPDHNEVQTVHPNQKRKGGVSVSKDWTTLPVLLIPERLRPLFPKARGSNTYAIFRFGKREYGSEAISNGLFLRWGASHHGTIEPIDSMPLIAYQSSLAATRDSWSMAEGDSKEAF
ncbi:MAG: hypothetical protein K8U03_12015 [Planctomycetia bacterium]|nr:hypothetical protein [Planctomycetia bacterium]